MSTGKEAGGRKGLHLRASFYPISDQPVEAVLEQLSQGHAYLTTEKPPKVGQVVRVVAGNCLQSNGDVLKIEHIAKMQYGFYIRLFHAEQTESSETSPGHDMWEFEPKCINEDSFQYYAQLRKVKEYVDEHYSDNVSLEKISQIAAMEKSYFSTFFRQKVGVTYGKWLQVQRVARAIDRIQKADSSITDICFAVGFGDLRTFERAFKRWTGLTPRAFKRMVSPLLMLAILGNILPFFA